MKSSVISIETGTYKKVPTSRKCYDILNISKTGHLIVFACNVKTKGLLREEMTENKIATANNKKFITHRITFIITFISPFLTSHCQYTRLQPTFFFGIDINSLFDSMEQITRFPDIYLFLFFFLFTSQCLLVVLQSCEKRFHANPYRRHSKRLYLVGTRI